MAATQSDRKHKIFLFLFAAILVGLALYFYASYFEFRLPTGDHRNFDARPGDLLDTQAVADVEEFQRFSPGAEVQAAVGQHPIDVQYQHADGGGLLGATQTTPARNRS